MLPILLGSLFFTSAVAVPNGLALTPQMGWNNWNALGCKVSESLLLDASTALVDLGLRDVGYKYVVLDDCWSDGRDDDGYIKVDQKRFPHGMKWMAAQLHNLGLLYGMYSSAGEFTCARYEGSLDHEDKDAESFASWDVDYLKYDNCFHRGRFGYAEVSFNRFNKMAEAIKKTGRPILYSLCSWGEDYVHAWGGAIANSWRMSGDIYDSFSRPDSLCACTNPADPHCVAPGSHCSVMHILNKVTPFVNLAFRGGWNDLDMLEVGLGGMSDEEYKAHFSMWAAVKSPLLIGADIRRLSPEALTILNNPAVIAVNQDPLGLSAARVRQYLDVKKDQYGLGESQIWSGPLYEKDQLVVFLNAADEDLEMKTDLSEIFVHEGPGGSAPQVHEEYEVRDLWANRMEVGTARSILSGNIKSAKDWYNATQVPYKEGLDAGDERILGKKVGFLGPEHPELSVTVPKHSVKMFRLRNLTGKSERYSRTKDEL